MTPVDAPAVAAVVSAIAALVSVCALVASVWIQWRGSRPRVEVVGQFATLLSRTTTGPTRFSIEVRNAGTLAVVVSSVGIIYGDGQLGALPDARTLLDEYVLPRTLQPGEAVTLTNDIAPILEAFRTRGIRSVYANTAAGRRFTGKQTANLAGYTE